MGVRGLKTFMEREGQCKPINMGSEIGEWKRKVYILPWAHL